MSADDIFGDLDQPTKPRKAKGGRRARAADTSSTDLFGDLDTKGDSRTARTDDAEHFSGTTSNVTNGSATTTAGRGGRRRRELIDDDREERESAEQKHTEDAEQKAAQRAAIEAATQEMAAKKAAKKSKKETDDFGGFDMSGLYFASNGGDEENDAPSGQGSNSFNPFGNGNTRNAVTNHPTKTRELDLNKKGPKKVKQTQKNTTKSTGPKWNRPTFDDFGDDDDLELDEEELGQGTIGNGNRAGSNVEKPELNSPSREQSDWTQGIEPAKKVEKPKKKKKKKANRHIYSDDEDDDDGIPSF